MEILVFAHRGEAQEFIKRLGMKPKDGKNALYEGANKLLFITGEGIYEVFSTLGPILGSYPITRVLNYGIAGSLSQDFEPGDFVSIRTVYCETEKLQFQSFTLADTHAQTDAITSTERVLTDTHADKLQNFAPVVDRELWAMAKLCAGLGIPLQSRKLISDFAGDSTECFDLKQRALEFSSSMLQDFLDGEEAISSVDDHATHYPLPMSFTQKARYRKALDALLRFPSFEENELAERAKELMEGANKKAAANALLDEMELRLNPAKKKVQESFNSLTSPITRVGGNILFDKNFEKKKFTLQMEINGQKNIENLKEGLEALTFSDFERIWEGKDV